MSRVSEWFDDWGNMHRSRMVRSDWPKLDTEAGRAFWDNIESAFVRHGASAEVADEASACVSEVPDVYLDKFLPLLVAAIKNIHARQQAEQKGRNATGPSTLDEAKVASKDCVDCGGGGLILRYVHASHVGRFATAGGAEFPVGARITLLCGCPLGEQMRRMNADAPRESRHRMGSILRSLEFAMTSVPWSDGLDNQFRYHPDDWDSIQGRPMPTPTADDVKAMIRKAVASGKAPGGSQARRLGGRWSNEPWASPELASEASRLREAIASQPEEYPVLPGGDLSPDVEAMPPESFDWQ